MIIVKNRELLVPLPERYLGTSYDTSSEIRQFRISRFAQNGTDLSPMTFYVDLLHADGSSAYDTITMGEVGDANYKVVDDNYIILTWYITRNVLQNPGALFVQLRAMDSENTVRWGSFKAVFYVERHLNAPGNYGGSLTLIEQIQQDHNYFKSVIDEVAALPQYVDLSEAWARGTRNGHAVEQGDVTYHNNAKYYSESAMYSAADAEEFEQRSQAYAEGKIGSQDVDSDDPAYHNNAKYYRDNAATSAGLSVAMAETAEAWAEGEINDDPVDSSHPAYHNNAKYYAEQAGTSATAAAQSAGQAGTNKDATQFLASSAGNSALNAEAWAVGKRGNVDVGSSDQTYHNNAKYYAEQAAGSATTAQQSAEQSGASAGLANTYKNQAQSEASNAAGSATNAALSALDASDAALNAEAWAKGTRNGTDVGSSDDAYHKNAKYYSEQAAASASAAAASAASLTVDSALSDTSTNPVQNKVITGELTDVKNALDALKIVDTASGAIASFPDGAAMPMESLTVEMSPIQEGTGDPSPDNVRPISGRTEVTVTRTGKNILDITHSFDISTGTLKGTEINLSVGTRVYVARRGGANSILYGRKKDGSYIEMLTITENVKTSVLSQDLTAIGISTGAAGNYGADDICMVSLEPFTDFVPYDGQSATIQLGQTVYGGTLDVTTGEMTVDTVFAQLAADTTYVTSGYVYFSVRGTWAATITNIPGMNGKLKQGGRYWSSVTGNDVTFSQANATSFCKASTSPIFAIKDSDSGLDGSASQAEVNTAINAWIHSNLPQIAYELRNPETIQLTPAQLTTLKGQNNVWSDADSVTVEYVADPKFYIARLTEPDADMVADANITSGSYFMVGNTLYLATSNIASGATITPGVNCTRTNLASALNAINA